MLITTVVKNSNFPGIPRYRLFRCRQDSGLATPHVITISYHHAHLQHGDPFYIFRVKKRFAQYELPSSIWDYLASTYFPAQLITITYLLRLQYFQQNPTWQCQNAILCTTKYKLDGSDETTKKLKCANPRPRLARNSQDIDTPPLPTVGSHTPAWVTRDISFTDHISITNGDNFISGSDSSYP